MIWLVGGRAGHSSQLTGVSTALCSQWERGLQGRHSLSLNWRSLGHHRAFLSFHLLIIKMKAITMAFVLQGTEAQC